MDQVGLELTEIYLHLPPSVGNKGSCHQLGLALLFKEKVEMQSLVEYLIHREENEEKEAEEEEEEQKEED